MARAASTLLAVTALIHWLPMSGVLSGEQLASLYGLVFDEPNLLILMRHRAVLLGIVGALLTLAVFDRSLRPAAFGLGGVSMLSFVALAALVGDANAELRRVAMVDGVGLLVLAGAFLCDRATARSATSDTARSRSRSSRP